MPPEEATTPLPRAAGVSPEQATSELPRAEAPLPKQPPAEPVRQTRRLTAPVDDDADFVLAPARQRPGLLNRLRSAMRPARQRSAKPQPSRPLPVPVPAEPDNEAAAPPALIDDTVRLPAPTGRARKALKPLPWGRDFAAAIIHRDDGLTAIFGKLDAADSPRVALVAPRGNKELSRALGMRRLRRHVDMTGKDVMIVTHSGSLRSRAHEVGLAVVGNVRSVDFERYGRGGVRLGGVVVPLPGFGLIVRLTFLLLAVAGIAAAVLLYLPDATVQVFPQVQTLDATANVTVGSDIVALNARTGEVPGHRRSTTITRTVQFPVHGQTTVKAPDGSDQQVAAATEDDITQATAFAQQVLLSEGLKALAQGHKDETLIRQTATLSAFDSHASVKAGEPANLLEVTAAGQVSMLSADNASLNSLLTQSLNLKNDAQRMVVPNTFTATTVSAGAFDKNNNRIQVVLKLSEGVTRTFSVSQLRKAVAGKSKLDAQQAVVERIDQTQPAKIKLQPGWAPWLPRFTNRITIVIGSPTAATGAAQPGATPSPSPTPKPQ